MKSPLPSSVHKKLKPEVGKDLCKHTPADGEAGLLAAPSSGPWSSDLAVYLNYLGNFQRS